MGKGKGGFSHWGFFAPAGKMLFEVRAPDLRIEVARDAFYAAGRILPGPVQFVQKKDTPNPAILGLKPVPKFHAGRVQEGRVDTKVRAKETPVIVAAVNIGTRKLKKGLTRG
jgi:Ribosomal protein L16p/L10e